MTADISHCPYCGTEFETAPDVADSRSSSGYRCDDCNEVMEIRVNTFPLA